MADEAEIPLLWPTATWSCGGKSGQTPWKRWYRPGLKREFGRWARVAETFQVEEVEESLVIGGGEPQG